MRSVLLPAALLLALTACKGGDPEDTDPADTDTAPPCTDADGDGFCVDASDPALVDCDDTTEIVNPDRGDIPYNGRDEDCDGSDLVDVDGDGVAGPSDSGEDCNDGNPTIFPGAPEECYEGVDSNCDGVTVLDDCDADGWPRSEDCNDKSDGQHPGLDEVWYDGVDQDCSYGSDYDQDADGDDSDAWGGGDCDDLDATVNANAVEYWDGFESDCDGVLDSLTNQDAWKNYDGAFVDYTWTSSLVVMNDYDGDGFPEIFAGDLAKIDADGDAFMGGGYVISTGNPEGRTDEVEVCEFNGVGKAELFGWSADNLGDLDGDGYDDLVVGAPAYEETGASLVFLGADMVRGGTIASDYAFATLWGVDVNAGLMVANMGDLDEDGVNDIASGTDINGLRQVAVYSGATVLNGGEFTTTEALAISSEYTALGGAIVGDVDIDGDGMDDVLTGRTTPDYVCGGGCSGTSRIYVTPGDSFRGGVTLSSDLFVRGGTESGLGQTIGFLNDITGDGYPELVGADPLTTALDGTPYGGTVYVVDGDDLVDNTDISALALWSMTADTGGTFLRVPRTTGDSNLDGVEDLFIGAPGQLDIYAAISGTFTTVGPGYVYYYDGATVAAGGTAESIDADATFSSKLSQSSFGLTLDVGDFNGDGRADLAVGAPLYGYGKLFLFESQL